MKRKFHHFPTLLTSNRKTVESSGIWTRTFGNNGLRAVLENHKIFSSCFSDDDSEIELKHFKSSRIALSRRENSNQVSQEIRPAVISPPGGDIPSKSALPGDKFPRNIASL